MKRLVIIIGCVRITVCLRLLFRESPHFRLGLMALLCTYHSSLLSRFIAAWSFMPSFLIGIYSGDSLLMGLFVLSQLASPILLFAVYRVIHHGFHVLSAADMQSRFTMSESGFERLHYWVGICFMRQSVRD